MLVCVCFGVIYFVVFGGFVLYEFVVCIDDVKFKFVFIVFCGVEINYVIEYKLLFDEVFDNVKYVVEYCIVF